MTHLLIGEVKIGKFKYLGQIRHTRWPYWRKFIYVRREVNHAMDREFKTVMYTNEYRFQWFLRKKSLPLLKIDTGPLWFEVKANVDGAHIRKTDPGPPGRGKEDLFLNRIKEHGTIFVDHPSLSVMNFETYLPYNLGSQEELKLLQERITEVLTRILKKAIEDDGSYEKLTVRFIHKPSKNQKNINNINTIDGFSVSYP